PDSLEGKTGFHSIGNTANLLADVVDGHIVISDKDAANTSDDKSADDKAADDSKQADDAASKDNK
ncbi:hypothetical protein, partial [uncultured Veillonella sp.]|uniref:hypothetical protein n=1 Tax=uncultured Veillonella sp. TaxID=159268 RepID=UPI0025D5E196